MYNINCIIIIKIEEAFLSAQKQAGYFKKGCNFYDQIYSNYLKIYLYIINYLNNYSTT